MGLFSLNKLAYFGVQNSFLYAAPSRFSYYYTCAMFKKVGVYRLDLFYHVFKSLLPVIGNVVSFHGKLFCGSSFGDLEHFIGNFVGSIGQFYTAAWSSGMLSNWGTYYKFIRVRYSYQISNVGTFRAFLKMDRKYRGILNMIYLPDVVLALTASTDASLCKEASVLLVPSVGIISQLANTSLMGVSYPFFGGGQSPLFIKLVTAFIFKSFLFFLSRRLKHRHYSGSFRFRKHVHKTVFSIQHRYKKNVKTRQYYHSRMFGGNAKK